MKSLSKLFRSLFISLILKKKMLASFSRQSGFIVFPQKRLHFKLRQIITSEMCKRGQIFQRRRLTGAQSPPVVYMTSKARQDKAKLSVCTQVRVLYVMVQFFLCDHILAQLSQASYQLPLHRPELYNTPGGENFRCKDMRK